MAWLAARCWSGASAESDWAHRLFRLRLSAAGSYQRGLGFVDSSDDAVWGSGVGDVSCVLVWLSSGRESPASSFSSVRFPPRITITSATPQATSANTLIATTAGT